MSHDGNSWKTSVRVSSRSDVGLRRANNQDAHAVVMATTLHQFHKRGHLLIVADGMGAHAAGELASKIAVDTISLSYAKQAGDDIAEALRNSVYDAHKQIRNQSERDEAFRDMGTTADALVLSPFGAVMAHVGDSRVYRLRDRVFEQMTFDHSLVWEIRASGKIPRDKIPSYIPKNVITRSLGPSDHLIVDLEGPFPVRSGDYFLLCSDGLSGQVEDDEIGQILLVLPPDYATETLINLANLRGGPDNITVVAAQVTVPLDVSGANANIPIDKAISGKTFSLLAWICLGFAILGLLLSGYSLLTDKSGSWPTMVSAIITLLFGGGFFFLAGRTVTGDDREDEDHALRHYGNGPYIRVDATPEPVFVSKLATTMQQLRDAAQDEQWNIHWADIDHHEHLAATAGNTEDFGKAVYHYALAINSMMRELKQQKRKKH
ncbi:MAG: protein phosphatase 2C domain-containing protein [Planctomycetaceae bacterium]|nr:protein phosphatase 2C domain-containing protein [Planctomycetaceae bacterium]